MKIKVYYILFFLLLMGLEAQAGKITARVTGPDLDGKEENQAETGGLSCLSVTFLPQVVLCGTTEITALVNCNFTGKVKLTALGNPPGVTIPGGDLMVTNGVFYFDVDIEEGAPSYFDILTTVTATYVDEENCVQDEVCEPSTLLANCYIPDNNDCSAAMEIPVAENECEYGIYSNHLSTASGLSGNCTNVTDHDVFFSFEASQVTTHINFGELCSNSMTLELYEACSSSSLYCISMGHYTNITFPELTPGQTYILRISDLQGDDQGTFEMCLWSPHICEMSVNSVVLENETCLDDCLGEATLAINDGTAPFIYSWSNGESSDTVQNLCAGMYTLEVSDDFGCIARDTFTIETGMSFEADAGENQSICQGDSVQLNASEGNSYRWSPSSGLDNAFIANPKASPLENTLYAVSILNELGCKATDTMELFVHSNPDPHILGDSLACAGDSIILDAGIGYVNYLWNEGDTSRVIWVKNPGNYFVMVSDTNACQARDSFYVEFLAPIESTYEIVHEYGNNFNNGSISAQITGGLAPYSLGWNQGDTSAFIDHLAPGTYTLNITDSLGCFRSDSVVIDSFLCPTFTLTYELLDASCEGGCEGSIELLEVENALMPLIYTWSNGDTAVLADSLCPGNYSLMILDSLNCTLQQDFDILNPGDLNLVLEEIVHAHAIEGGSIDISIGENIIVSWAGPNNFESDSVDIYDLLPGCYTLFATDTLSGCMKNTTYCIQDLTATSFITNNKSRLKAFPQPADDLLHLEWLEDEGLAAEIKLISLEGQVVYRLQKDKNTSMLHIPTKQLPNGLYLLWVQSEQSFFMQKCLIAR